MKFQCLIDVGCHLLLPEVRESFALALPISCTTVLTVSIAWSLVTSRREVSGAMAYVWILASSLSDSLTMMLPLISSRHLTEEFWWLGP